MKKILASLRTITLSFLAGAVAGSIAVYFYLQKDTPVGNEVVVRQISGERIDHDNFNFRGNTITFQTASQGVGVIETEIPKLLIPEAYNWMKRVHTLTFSIGLDNRQSAYYGIMYGYRINRITLGGGMDLGNNFFGIKASVGYCW